MKENADKIILDVCCGGRMMWFDKKHPSVLFVDKREIDIEKLKDGSNFEVKPDIIMDFCKLDLPDNQFNLVVFDPPHMVNVGKNSVIGKKYGILDRENWQEDIKQGFAECFRVLKPNGVLIFKWNEYDIPVNRILELTPVKPLFGHRSGRSSKTHWIAFIKQNL